MKDADWLYHLTRKNVALIIQKGGMTSALTRIGLPVANPRGAFVNNRKAKEEGEFQQKLKGYLTEMLRYGASKEQILQTKGVYVPFNLIIQGSNDYDVPRVDNIEKLYLDRYKGLLLIHGNKEVKLKKDPTLEEMSQMMLVVDKNHFLSRLAVQYVAHRNNIEEAITASHVYFLKPDSAVDGYKDYKKHLNSNDIVVLRVHRDNLPGLVDDDSDFRAKMTDRTVPPNVIEVMVNHDNFADEDYRSNAQNWQPLANLQ
ncbi:MAG TPA: hypothetical protein VGD58_01450 [Herpetosiphonaceae bacterium]